MIKRDHPTITIKRQAELLSVNRTSVYRQPETRQESTENIRIMHAIDKWYTKYPFRLQANDEQAAGNGRVGEWQACAASDAFDGHSGGLPGTEPEQAISRRICSPLLVARKYQQ